MLDRDSLRLMVRLTLPNNALFEEHVTSHRYSGSNSRSRNALSFKRHLNASTLLAQCAARSVQCVAQKVQCVARSVQCDTAAARTLCAKWLFMFADRIMVPFSNKTRFLELADHDTDSSLSMPRFLTTTRCAIRESCAYLITMHG